MTLEKESLSSPLNILRIGPSIKDEMGTHLVKATQYGNSGSVTNEEIK